MMRCFSFVAPGLARCCAVLMTLPGLALAEGAGGGGYVRAGLAWQDSDDVRFSDRDCASVAPPALFGCAEGDDGQPIGARGDFGHGALWQLGLGWRFNDSWRVEAGLGGVEGMAFSGQANFVHVPGAEPVSGDLRSRFLLAEVLRDFDAGWAGARPWLSVGLGVARHSMGSMTYAFPGLAPQAVTLMPGGETDALMWRLGAGVGFDLGGGFTLDVGGHYTDFGTVETEAGEATIVRARGTRQLRIDGTEAPLRGWGLGVGLRRSF